MPGPAIAASPGLGGRPPVAAPRARSRWAHCGPGPGPASASADSVSWYCYDGQPGACHWCRTLAVGRGCLGGPT
eukprot:687339-Hanusia_phi.AAC.1